MPESLLDTSAFLTLFQSVLRQRRRAKSFLPEGPEPAAVFGAREQAQAASSEEWQAVCADMESMLFPEGSGEAGELLRLRPCARMADTAAAVIDLWRAGKRTIGVRTSGSTGHPKVCVHAEEELIQEALWLRDALAPKGRILSAVPPQHLYGLTTSIFLPRLCGREAVFLPALSTLVLSAIRPGDTVIGIPLLWDAAAKSAIRAPEGRPVTLLSAAAPLRAATAAALAARGFVPREVYGSSETGIVGLRDDVAQPFRLVPYMKRLAAPDASAGADVTLVERSLLSGGRLVLELMDSMVWSGDRNFLPSGRLDSLVQVGGVNVSPSRLKNCLLALPEVAECCVRPMRPEEGSRLKAFVVPAGGCGERAVRAAVRRAVRALLPEERPGSLTLGDRLPVSDMGKLRDW
ncbi:MAG: AMP-binding protein [Desulfovibrionaceae bacterium]|nr:AMP-binding protein [Desulfovibrionaceae bacterium]